MLGGSNSSGPMKRGIAGRLVTACLLVSAAAVAFLSQSEPVSADPLLQLPWPAGQIHKISSAGNGYNCDTHTGKDMYAIDFNLSDGQQVSAVADGVVHNVQNGGGYGKLVWVDHGNGFVSIYAHLQSTSLSEGTNVFHGTVVGLSDNTGSSTTGAHLHFALRSGATSWNNGTPYKPEPMSGYSGFDQYGDCTGQSSQDYYPASPVGAVGASSWSSSRLDTFTRWSDSSLYQKFRDVPSAWSGWVNLGGTITSGPSADSWGSGRIDVFGRAVNAGGNLYQNNGKLYQKYFSGTWSAWVSLGGELTSAPAVASWGSGRLDVFARGLDGKLYHQWYSGAWSGWAENWQGPLGQPIASNPTAVSRGYGLIDIFVRGADGQMYHGWFDGTWHFWESLGGQIASGPAAASWSSGRLDVFARGLDGRLYHQYWNAGTGWSGWVEAWDGPAGAALASDPGAVSRTSGIIDVFARGSTGKLYHGWFDGTWHFWDDFGGTLY